MEIIRKAALTDSETIAEYLFFAMAESVYQFIGKANPKKGNHVKQSITVLFQNNILKAPVYDTNLSPTKPIVPPGVNKPSKKDGDDKPWWNVV